MLDKLNVVTWAIFHIIHNTSLYGAVYYRHYQVYGGCDGAHTATLTQTITITLVPQLISLPIALPMC